MGPPVRILLVAHRHITHISLTAIFRVCPGQYLANATIWLAVARILAVFDIAKPRDENGEVVEPRVEFIEGMSR